MPKPPKEKKKSIDIRITFKGKLAQRLNTLMEYYEVENYTDLIRFLVTKSAEEIQSRTL